MVLTQSEIHNVGTPKHNKTKNIKIKSLSGYDAIMQKLDGNNTLTVKHQPIESVKPKTKMSIGLNQTNYSFLKCMYVYIYIYIYIENYGSLSSKWF